MKDTIEHVNDMSLTDYEVIGLRSSANLADGHAYQDLDEAQRKVVKNLSYIWELSETKPHSFAEDRFVSVFSDLASAPSLANRDTLRLICPTASNSIDVAAAYLKKAGRVVYLIEPTFDNLFLLMRRREVSVKPIPEEVIYDYALESLDETLRGLSGQALFVVNPNNPTSRIIDKVRLKELARLCAGYDILLIIDNSFRFQKREHFDDYQLLIDSGVSFICIEDTGKVWPTQDMKASILSFSKNLKESISTIYYEIYLCVSPFTLNVISEFVNSAIATGLDTTLWKVIDDRRRRLRCLLPSKELAISSNAVSSSLSVEWVECKDPAYNDVETVERLQSSGLAVLPGRNFYWASSHNLQHQRHIRLSLLKKEKDFSIGLDCLARHLRHAS